MAAARQRERTRAKVRRKRPSSITQLDGEVRSELDRLLTEGKFTITDITKHLQRLGAPVSRSAVHRYSQHQEQIASDIRYTREMATAIGRELEDVSGDAGRLVIESMQALLLRARMEMAEGDEIDPKSLGELTRSAKDLQHALKLNVETEVKIRERVLAQAAGAVEEVAKSEGFSAETVDMIKRKILGLA